MGLSYQRRHQIGALSHVIVLHDKREFKRCLHDTILSMMEDGVPILMKASTGNKPKPNFLCPSSVDWYYARSRRGENGIVERAAYGLGSGSGTIGLDKRQFQIFPFKGPMKRLVWLVKGYVKELYPDETWNIDFNAVSVKVYQGDSATPYHCDINRRMDGTPYEENTQEPNSPVIILTVGDDKRLYFRKFMDTGGNKNIGPKSSEFCFLQKSGSITLLHPRDEIPMERPSDYGRINVV